MLPLVLLHPLSDRVVADPVPASNGEIPELRNLPEQMVVRRPFDLA